MPKKRESGEFSAASMADIAFLLLIFFLVTTTMDVDTGLMRMLPPPNDGSEAPPVRQRNVFMVLVNQSDKMMVEGEPTDISVLKEKTKEFVLNPLNAANLPEKNEKDIPLLGKRMVSKGVVSLQNDRGTSYEKYIEVQNEIMAAFNELRDDLAMEKFGKKFDDLSKDRSKAIRMALPMSISEAEPKNIGGK